jgi:hypothetical protein
VIHIGMSIKEAPPNRSDGEVNLIQRHSFHARPWIVFEWVSLASGPQMTTASTVHDAVGPLCRVQVPQLGGGPEGKITGN